MPQYREFEISNLRFFRSPEFIRVICVISGLFTVNFELRTRCQDFQSASPNSRLPLLDVVFKVPGSVRGSPPVAGCPHEGVTYE